MLYIMSADPTTGASDRAVILLEPEALDNLKKGQPISTPDGRVVLGYMPDPVWTREQLHASNGDIGKVVGIIRDGALRPPTGVHPMNPSDPPQYKAFAVNPGRHRRRGGIQWRVQTGRVAGVRPARPSGGRRSASRPRAEAPIQLASGGTKAPPRGRGGNP